MHVLADVVPGDGLACAVGAEDGVRGIPEVQLRIIAAFLDDPLLVVTGEIAGKAEREAAGALGVGANLLHVVDGFGHRYFAADHSLALSGGTCVQSELRRHAVEVGEGPSGAGLGHLQREFIPGLQQDATGIHETVPDRPVGGLAEIAAFRVLEMGFPVCHRDLHVGDGGSGEHAQVLLLLQVGEDQPLPVCGQTVRGNLALEDQSAARLAGREDQVDLRVVAQGFKVADAFHGVGDGLAVGDASAVKTDLHVETFCHQILQDLGLDLTHQLHPDLFGLLIPENVKLGLLLLEAPELRQHGGGIDPVRKQDAVAEHGGEQGHAGGLFRAETFPGPGLCEAGDRDDSAGRRFLQRRELLSVVVAELVRLLAELRDHHLRAEGTAGDLHPGQAGALFVPGDLEDPGTKVLRIIRHRRKAGEAGEQRSDSFGPAVQLPRVSEPAGEKLPGADQAAEVLLAHGRSVLQIALHQSLVQQRELLLDFRGVKAFPEVKEAAAEHGVQLVQDPGADCRLLQDIDLVHLVDEEEDRDPVGLEKPPESDGVALHAVRRADHEDCRVQHLERALGLRGEVHMSRGVQQGEFRVFRAEHGLLGENGDAALPLLFVSVKESIARVDPPCLPENAGLAEQRLGKRGLSRVDMGENTDGKPFQMKTSF